MKLGKHGGGIIEQTDEPAPSAPFLERIVFSRSMGCAAWGVAFASCCRISCWGAHASNSAWQPSLHLLHLPLGLSAHNTNRLLSMSLFLYETIFIL